MTRDIPLRVEPARCRVCRQCLAAKACKVRAIVKVDADEPPYIDSARCYDCRRCLPACPFGALMVSRIGLDTINASAQA